MLKGKEYFDNLAASWDEKFKPDYNKIKYILSLLGDIKNLNVLDAGTGTGVLIPSLHSAGTTVDAIDISEKMIEVGSRKFPSMAAFKVADIQAATMDKTYDIIICHNVYPHFEDKAKTLHNISSHLKPGGRLLIAHSASREEINRRHKQNEQVKDDVLPPVRVVAKLAEDAGFHTVYLEDGAEVYVYLGVLSPAS